MDWTRPAAPPPLDPGDAHVWRVDLARSHAEVARDADSLSADERRRSERFRFPAHRDRYVAAHAALRAILAGYLELDPAAVRYRRGPAGKPFLAPGLAPGDLQFNLTDSGDVALVAVTEGRELGVDLERHRPETPVLALAQRWLTPSEAAAIRATPETARRAAFFACWTRKEAYVKARGGSIIRSLRTFSVTVEPAAERIELDVHGDPAAGSRWWIGNLEAAPGFAAALAADGEVRVRRYQWG